MEGRLIRIHDPSEDSRWDDFVSHHRFGTFYHLSAWASVIERTYGYSPMYYAVEDDEGRLTSAIPIFRIESRVVRNRLVCLPFTTACDPLVNSSSEFLVLIESILGDMDNYNARYLEIRTFRNSHIFGGLAFRRLTSFKNHVLALGRGDPEELRRSFHKSCIQRSIKKAEKSPLEIVIGSSENDMRKFYKLQTLTRKKHGLPPQPYRYYSNMWKILYPKGFLTLLLAELSGEAIAGVVIVRYGNTAYYQNGGSDPNHLFLRPNHLLLWTAIKMACEHGCEYFDFGRSSAYEGGLIAFKQRWGTQEYELPYLFYPRVRGVTSHMGRNSLLYKTTTRVFRKTPSVLLPRIGDYIYKYLG